MIERLANQGEVYINLNYFKFDEKINVLFEQN